MTVLKTVPRLLPVAVLALLGALASGCGVGVPDTVQGGPAGAVPQATGACPPSESDILAAVKDINSGVLPAGARVARAECVEDFVVVSLDSDTGPAVALLRRAGEGYEALEMGGDLCGSSVLDQAPAEVRVRLHCLEGSPQPS